MLISRVLFVVTIIAYSFQAQAALINVSASQIEGTGELIGAKNVSVNGSFYDVTFTAGLCSDLFNGCDETSDFTFQDLPSVTAAMTALRDQVFGGVFEGSIYDTDPTTVSGIGSVFSGLSFDSLLWTPYEFRTDGSNNIRTLAFGNNSGAATDIIIGPGGGLNIFFPSDSPFAWAVWSESSVSVPEPSSIALLALGIIGLGFANRKKTA